MKLFSKEKNEDKTILNILGIKISYKRKLKKNVSPIESPTFKQFEILYQKQMPIVTSKRILIHTYSVGCLYTALAVMKNLFEDCQVDILLTSYSDVTTKSVLKLSEDIDCVSKLSLISDSYINKLEMMQYQSENTSDANNIEAIKNKVHEDFQSEYYDAVIYGFDLTTSLIGILKNSFPETKLITIGDGNAFLIDKVSWKNYKNIPVKDKNVFEFTTPDIAMNLLPVKLFNFFEKTQLKVLPAKEYLESFKLGHKTYKKLDGYSKKMILKYQNKTKCFFMSENFAQAGAMSYEDEIELFSGFIRKYCPTNSVVFIKSHPIESISRLDEYKRVLGEDWELVDIDKEFVSYPVEMMSEFIENSEIIISCGMPKITLKHLYNKDVKSPFSEDMSLVHNYFKTTELDETISYLELMEKAFESLNDWDKKDFLCSGNLKNCGAAIK